MASRKYFKEHFDEIYRGIRDQAPLHHFEFSDPFWVLITTMLSHRTKDAVTDDAARKLYSEYGDCRGLANAEYEDVLKIIGKVGFRTKKAARIIQAAAIIRDRFKSKVPETREELMEIPGVGRKTANVVMSDSMGIPAIAVDTHVHRISNRIGFCKSSDPLEVENALMRIVPEEQWVGFNPAMVEFGKTICKPIGPRCGDCNVSSFCSYFSKKGVSPKKKESPEKGK